MTPSATDIQAALDAKAKPPGALGRLDPLAARVAAVQGTLQPDPDPARVVVFAADHGVAADGVSAYPAAVTPAMARTIAAGGAAVSVLARSCGASVEVVDVGIDADLADAPGIVHAKGARGTKNLARGPAMTEAECAAAWRSGADAARRAADAGARTLVPGEVGIGNTTAAAAVLAALFGWKPEEAIGRGTGVDDAGLARKAEAVCAGLARVPDEAGPKGVLRHVGGLEIAAMAGAFAIAPALGLVAVVDGFVATAAAAVAVRHDPAVAGHLVAGHVSAEAAHRRALAALDLEPVLDLGMRLGEGTGGVLALPILRAACAVLCEMATLDEALALGAPASEPTAS
ncbi:MAG: nicotinate-nucleotide--dimethylbenzimidazole phosphoribosyltransferase [Bacteroidota bacterium]